MSTLSGKKNGTRNKIFSKKGNQGKEWHWTNATFVSNNSYMISFEATRGAYFTGDIAVDDIIFLDHGCDVTPEKTTIAPTTNTPDGYSKVGCYKDKGIRNARPFPKLIKNYRESGLNWYDLKTSVVDKCAELAKKNGYKYFGIQFFGECWSGPDSKVHYSRDGIATNCYQSLTGVGGSLMVFKTL